MSEPLFFFETLPEVGQTLVLTGEEAQHAAGARRLGSGDTLSLFDGRGTQVRAELLALDKRGRSIELRVVARREAPPPQPLHLMCALPKGDRQAVLLDMATQLGITDFTPLVCDRSVVMAGEQRAGRWARICLGACKQSRRLFLPRLHPPASPGTIALRGAALLAHPDGVALRTALPEASAGLTILIGPEGGFTDPELHALEVAGARRVSLGAGILRIETAAVALLAATQLAR